MRAISTMKTNQVLTVTSPEGTSLTLDNLEKLVNAYLKNQPHYKPYIINRKNNFINSQGKEVTVSFADKKKLGLKDYLNLLLDD